MGERKLLLFNGSVRAVLNDLYFGLILYSSVPEYESIIREGVTIPRIDGGFVLYSVQKRTKEREKKKKYNPIHEVKIHSTKKQYQHLASIASFSPSPPPVDLGGTAPRDVRLSLPRRATALLGLLLSSTSSLLLFFFFSLFFFPFLLFFMVTFFTSSIFLLFFAFSL